MSRTFENDLITAESEARRLDGFSESASARLIDRLRVENRALGRLREALACEDRGFCADSLLSA
ncbi:hypothetical protein GCM10011390_07930 [Aureimonas endophytica]|uniref:Uncharacterized protein n=1 Tax=Aureimonas endophytica TaxID=2027858 RepID=A0A916ZF81_9HYPH|nr:hypothetical protein [Aureimonas endophytica]GGD91603.1 hypothetical protein GCM10011390_07930 [Aureimonas endophytica]